MYITLNSNPSYSYFLESYYNSIRVLFNCIVDEQIKPEEISVPLLFLIRHSLEMGYKGNINYLAKFSKLDDCVNYSKHSIHPLHVALKKHFDKAKNEFSLDKKRIKEFNQYYKEIEKLADFFESLDKESITFRYPVNKQGKKTMIPIIKIPVIDLFTSYERIMKFLIFLTDLLLSNIETFCEENNWVLSGGLWNDKGIWDDSKRWNDGI